MVIDTIPVYIESLQTNISIKVNQFNNETQNRSKRKILATWSTRGVLSLFTLTLLTGVAPNTSYAQTNNIEILGLAPDSHFGHTVSQVGDLNGDTWVDFAVSAPTGGLNGEGMVYVFFGGTTTFPQSVEPGVLDGTNGFEIRGTHNGDRFGHAIAPAGDMNGDGIDDFIIGAPLASPDGLLEAGVVHVLFGRDYEDGGSFEPTIQVANLSAEAHFTIHGLNAGDQLGTSVAGDVDLNDDQFNDLILGAPMQEVLSDVEDVGAAYIVLGRDAQWGDTFDLASLDGGNGFIMSVGDPDAAAQYIGFSVDGIRDLNGDGIDDLVVGGPVAGTTILGKTGHAFVVFGATSFPAHIDPFMIAEGQGFAFHGPLPFSGTGAVVKDIGDINHDGLTDLAIGAPSRDANGIYNSGETYILYGRADGFPNKMNPVFLEMQQGLIVQGSHERMDVGASINAAGDINSDGINDLLIGVPDHNTSGEAFVFFGSQDLSDAPDSFRLPGTEIYNPYGGGFGFAVHGVGDINADGVDDIVIGAPRLNTNGSSESRTGAVYLIFGSYSNCPGRPLPTQGTGITSTWFDSTVLHDGNWSTYSTDNWYGPCSSDDVQVIQP